MRRQEYQFRQLKPARELLLLTWVIVYAYSNESLALPEDEEALITTPSIFFKKPYVELGGSYEHLTNGYASWSSEYLDVTLPLEQHGLLYMNLMNANRFSQNDTAGYLNYAYPTAYGVLNAEGGYTINPQFLTKDLYGIGWNGRLPYQFSYLLSARASEYQVGNTRTINMGLDKYWLDYRFAYTLVRSVLDYEQRTWLSKYEMQWLSESGHRIGLTYATGHEPMVVTIGNLTNIDVVTYQVNGLLQVSQSVALSASAWHSMQGSYYQRNGGQVGLRLSF